MAELSIIDRAAKSEGDNSLILEAVSLLKIGAASPVIASTSMLLLLTGLGKIKVGTTYKNPNDSNTLFQIDKAMSDVYNAFTNWLFQLGGQKPPGSPVFAPTATQILADGVDKDGKEYWNVYLLDPVDATNFKLGILSYLVATGIGGTGGSSQLGSLISGGIAALK